jgi:uncharacterized protein (DUF362 family)
MATNEGVIDLNVVAESWKKLLLALTGKVDVKGAWAQLIPDLASTHVVGLKVNTLNADVPTHPEVVKAVVDSLKDGLGLTAERILVWDRRLDELQAAGLTADVLGATVEGTWENSKEKGIGRGYEVSPICLASRKTKLSNILTRRIDHLINIAVVKRHVVTGVTGCMKNHYGSIDTPGDFHDNHERRYEKALPQLNLQPEIVSKTRLWVLDASVVVCEGGTEDGADAVPRRLAVGLDPVALDVHARTIRDEARASIGIKPDTETISESWIKGASQAGLGSPTVKLQPIT